MKPCLLAFAAVAALFFPVTIHAQQEMTLGDLKDFCSTDEASSRSACNFFIYGVTSGIKISAAMSKERTHFCIPDEVGNDFVVALVKEQMRHDLAAFPADKKLPAVSFVSSVLARQYPCKL